ncbi:MAG TPA: phosphomannomutase/phosphoglucomutase [Nocardioidaceae bacterium]|nr:phosphomannomutase/phosphoglucomutase [Nocardioidaceae bacterium]
MPDLSAVFKAYDVRGRFPDQLDETTAERIGAAFVDEVLDGSTDPGVVVGHDMRQSSPPLAAAFIRGVCSRGVDVVAIGLASTDELYFASGRLGLPGAMFTASHNPADDNGIKLCRAGALALSAGTGLLAIRDRVASWDADSPTAVAEPGTVEHRDLLQPYADFLHDLVPVSGRRLKVVVDAANGMAGHTVPAVFANLGVELVPMYFELDGTFPNHQANPLDPVNLRDLQRAVVAERADLGLAFDGDADRCFVVDEAGAVVPPSALTGLIAVRELAREPGARVIHNLISSRAVPETIRRHGGTPVRTPVGHSLIKATMASSGAVFGGEHSGHYYFRDFWCADSGMLAALHVLAALAAGELSVSELVAEFNPYAASGELNFRVPDPAGSLRLVEEVFATDDVDSVDHLDGLTVTGTDWWFNVRPSNTEPLLRVNVEAETEPTMVAVRDRVLSLLAGPHHRAASSDAAGPAPAAWSERRPR